VSAIDAVYATLNVYSLPTHVEQLTFYDLHLGGATTLYGLGNDASNTMYALRGNSGGTGGSVTHVTLNGGRGNDTLHADFANNTLIGGSGDDTYVLYEPPPGFTPIYTIVENAVEGTDSVWSWASYSLGGFLENLYLRTSPQVGNPSLLQPAEGWGNSLNNIISGSNTGASTLWGFDGSDALYGGTDSDTLTGGTGNDLLVGYSLTATFPGETSTTTDRDTLNGGTGNDSLYGGRGDDLYVIDTFQFGRDVLEDNGYAADNDVLRFQLTSPDPLGRLNVALVRRGWDLLVGMRSDTNQAVTIANHFRPDNTDRIETIQYVQGTTTWTLSHTTINTVTAQMASYAATRGIALSSVSQVATDATLMSMVQNAWV
jgi:hypothetical protein